MSRKAGIIANFGVAVPAGASCTREAPYEMLSGFIIIFFLLPFLLKK